MAGDYSQIGHFPADGVQAREDKVFYKLTEDDAIKLISGDRTPALISLFCSNDVVQFGTEKILAGGPGPQQTEADSHPGDGIFYVLDGPATFFFPERTETYDVQEGDFMFVPAGEKYKIINFTGHAIKVVFIVAPTL